MGIEIVGASKKESADVDKLKPGDTFEDQADNLFLVTDIKVSDIQKTDEGDFPYFVINLTTGKAERVEVDELIDLVDLAVSKRI